MPTSVELRSMRRRSLPCGVHCPRHRQGKLNLTAGLQRGKGTCGSSRLCAGMGAELQTHHYTAGVFDATGGEQMDIAFNADGHPDGVRRPCVRRAVLARVLARTTASSSVAASRGVYRKAEASALASCALEILPVPASSRTGCCCITGRTSGHMVSYSAHGWQRGGPGARRSEQVWGRARRGRRGNTGGTGEGEGAVADDSAAGGGGSGNIGATAAGAAAAAAAAAFPVAAARVVGAAAA